MRQEVMNRVTMLKSSVVAEVAASRPGLRRWLMVQPDADANELTRLYSWKGPVMVVDFEHDVRLDPDDYGAPEDIQNRRVSTYPDLATAINTLQQQGINTDIFDAPWNSDYPL